MPKKQRPADPAEPLDVALSLARHGWHVFPLRTDGSKSPVKGMLWHDRATTDPEQIATWWGTDYPGALIGVHAGRSGLHIVDVDEKGCDNERHPDECTGSGSAELAAAAHDLPATFHYATPSGGAHHVYRAPADAALTIAQDYPVRHVDIRAGVGFVAYYGPALADAPELAAAPEYTLKRKENATGLVSNTDRGDGDVNAWLERATPGKPDKAVKAARNAVKSNGMGHGDMLDAVTELVKLGTAGHRGAGDALLQARETYLADYPEAARHWDNAVSGSVKRHGLPPVSIPLTKAERSALKERASRPKGELTNRAPASSANAGARYLEDSPVAEEIAAKLVNQWAWVQGTGVMRYDGIVWKPADETALIEAVRQALKPLVAEEVRAAVLREDKGSIKSIVTLLNRSRIAAVSRLTIGMLAERGDETDAHPDLLNVRNGVVDLTTGELLPHDAAYMFTRVAGCEYDPEAKDPAWSKALEALPTKSVRKWLQARFGQALTGYTPEDAVMPIFKGSGENGKSTTINAIRSAAGTYAVTISDQLLLASPGDHPTALTDLMGARMAFFEELPEGRNLNVKRLKDAVGTDYLTARRMRQDNITWKTTHAIFGSTNYVPIVAETDHGTWRRLALVIFPYTYVKPGEPLVSSVDRHGDPALRDAFNTAHPAVLAWLVQGAVEWYARGRHMPPLPKRVVEDTLEWRTDADPILGYTRDMLELDEGYAIPVRNLCDDFNHYLEQRSQKRWSDSTITARFAGHVALPGVEKTRVRAGLTTKWSTPTFTVSAPPPVAVALRGVRFKASEEAPSSGNVTPFTPRGGKPPHDQHDLG